VKPKYKRFFRACKKSATPPKPTTRSPRIKRRLAELAADQICRLRPAVRRTCSFWSSQTGGTPGSSTVNIGHRKRRAVRLDKPTTDTVQLAELNASTCRHTRGSSAMGDRARIHIDLCRVSERPSAPPPADNLCKLAPQDSLIDSRNRHQVPSKTFMRLLQSRNYGSFRRAVQVNNVATLAGTPAGAWL